ncbi:MULTISPECIES: LysR family transcriptional regulator [unclassified Variovorax]|uniref:LysR family transcriptional regulator n=1 Tax=unclassified Variovorax TaxID=663243 RepID=UPI003F45F399
MKDPALDLNDVAMFVEVVCCGSFAEAARRLRVPSATVSRRIQQLEIHLGVRLMHRSTRNLTLTEAGQDFHEQCGPAVQELMRAGRRQRMDNRELKGLVRVAAPVNFFKLFQMEWANAFLDEHPLVRLEFVLSDLLADLIAERIDIAFRGGPLSDSSYVVRKIFTSYGELLASPAYLAAHGAPTTLQELTKHECVISPPDSGNCSTWRLQGPDDTEVDVKVSGRFISDSLDAQRLAACAGLGIAALPSVLTVADVESGKLVPVLPQYKRTGHGLSVLYTSQRQLPQAVSAFADMAVAKLCLQDWAPRTGIRAGKPVPIPHLPAQAQDESMRTGAGLPLVSV